MNTWGSKIRLSIFGESHGEGIGIVIDGLPVGFEPDMDFIRSEMARRAPGKDKLSTPRKEADSVRVLSGLFNGKTTGAPVCGFIENTNTISTDYTPGVLRPSHADYPAYVKYKGFNDYRGGGHFSGRLTAPLVFAGAMAKQILSDRGVKIAARIASIGGIRDCGCTTEELFKIQDREFPVFDKAAGEKMKALIMEAKSEGDSVGGIIECAAVGIPAGLGEPFFSSMESIISGLAFSIPAVKGIEFGAGFGFEQMRGSAANDALEIVEERLRLVSNNSGGINGGITNGAALKFRTVIKPTSTIGREQQTVDIAAFKNIKTCFKGRHDPCIVQRAVVVIESVAALCILEGECL